MKKLLLCVTYKAKHGMREEFIKEISSSGLLETIRKEDGCIEYEYCYSVLDEDKILLVEQWESEEKQQAHVMQPHMDRLRALKEKYIYDTKLEKAFSADN